MSIVDVNIKKLDKRIREIKCSNEMLNYGLSELEAVYLRIQADMVPDQELAEIKGGAVVLNAKNRCLAHKINKALKEVESNLRATLDGGIYVDKIVVHEFSEVLRESIRTLHDYRLIEEAYQDYTKRSYNNSVAVRYGDNGNRKREKSKEIAPTQKFHRVIKILCLCGSFN